jgi:type III restriction enzyme
VKYDLIGNLAEATQLTRHTIAAILKGVNVAVFSQYKTNPEDFIAKAGTLINEQKATAIVEHIAYDPVDETLQLEHLYRRKAQGRFQQGIRGQSTTSTTTCSPTRAMSERLLRSWMPVSKSPFTPSCRRAFFIPTPVGNYNPDWAIAFQDGKVKHIYFIAETKGSMSTLDLRAIENSKIACARKFFARITSDQVKYDVVDSYGKLMGLVK